MELPLSFVNYTCSLLGDEEYQKMVEALNDEQPVSIRLNDEKIPNSSFGPFAFSLERVPWAMTGFYLDQRLTFTFDPWFHAGCYYVQEASSMFVEQALKQYVAEEPVVMLDLCAAPGGKSTHALDVLPAGSLLVANEVIRSRSQILAENLTKWGYPGVVVTNNDPADFASLENSFDVILTDVPCSGEGMFRKDPVAVAEWSSENVEICWQRQRRIITDIWSSLKPGGILIYSTCTYNTKEDEENVRWIRSEFSAEVLPLEIPDNWNIIGNLLVGEEFPVYRFLPHKTRGEGFFLSVLRKPKNGVQSSWSERFLGTKEGFEGLEEKKSSFKKKEQRCSGKDNKKMGIAKEQLAVLKQWVLDSDKYEFLLDGECVAAFPKQYLSLLSILSLQLRVLQAGTEVGVLKGKDWLPSHALAMSLVLRPDVFVHEEIGYEQAIAYLRKEAVVLPDTTPHGVVLLTYKRVPLGFVKNVGNRANNLYPQEWRIRSGYLPQEVKTILG